LAGGPALVEGADRELDGVLETKAMLARPSVERLDRRSVEMEAVEDHEPATRGDLRMLHGHGKRARSMPNSAPRFSPCFSKAILSGPVFGVAWATRR